MVFVIAPKTKHSETSEISNHSELSSDSSKLISQQQLLQAVFEGFIDGVMILDDQGKILWANLLARHFCHELILQTAKDKSTKADEAQTPPQEVWQVCENLIESRDLFPEQKIVLEFEVNLKSEIVLRIRVQWFDLDVSDRPCLIVTLEDRNQAIRNKAIADIQKYQLTPREGDVWKLRLQGCSYRDVATRLYIAENTVKRYVKTILAKRRAVLDLDEG